MRRLLLILSMGVSLGFSVASKSRLVALLSAILSAILLALFASSAQPLSAQQVDFAKEVYPVLESNCFKCHGEKKAKAELKLPTSADVLKGGKSGQAIEPGKSAESLLIKRLPPHKEDEGIIPPKRGPPSPATASLWSGSAFGDPQARPGPAREGGCLPKAAPAEPTSIGSPNSVPVP